MGQEKASTKYSYSCEVGDLASLVPEDWLVAHVHGDVDGEAKVFAKEDEASSQDDWCVRIHPETGQVNHI